MQLEEVKALVTGGASGMGRAFTLELAEAGADVAFCDLDEAGVAEVVAAGEPLPGRVVGFEANVAVEDDVVGLVGDAWHALGGLNVLVNNAGIFRDGLLVKRDRRTGDIAKMSLSQWQAVLDVDLTGPFLCTREFAARLIEAETKPAVVVNISSISRQGNRGQGNYSAAKAGLVADTKVWALELARHGIRVGAIAPGFVHTPILDAMRPEILQGMIDMVPLRRMGTTHDLFLALKFIVECDYFTGRCLDVDGGLVM